MTTESKLKCTECNSTCVVLKSNCKTWQCVKCNYEWPFKNLDAKYGKFSK